MQNALVRRVDTTDSTNRLAREWAREGAKNGAFVVAAAQTGGRGRRGRAWESAPGLGLWLSAILRPEAPEAKWPLLAYAAALSVADAIMALTGKEPFIKWPNDILIDGRKVCGILLERDGDAVIIGIGINVMHQPDDFPQVLRGTATSLAMACDTPISPQDIEIPLMESLTARARAWDFLPEYRARCGTLGRAVRVEAPGETFFGTASGITEDGALAVTLESGEVRPVFAGDVTIRDGGIA